MKCNLCNRKGFHSWLNGADTTHCNNCNGTGWFISDETKKRLRAEIACDESWEKNR